MELNGTGSGKPVEFVNSHQEEHQHVDPDLVDSKDEAAVSALFLIILYPHGSCEW